MNKEISLLKSYKSNFCKKENFYAAEKNKLNEQLSDLQKKMDTLKL